MKPLSPRPSITDDPLAAGCDQGTAASRFASPWTMLAILCVPGLVIACTGCKTGIPFPRLFGGGPSIPTPPHGVPGDPFWFLGPLAGALVTLGALALIASVVVPLIPRKAAVTAIVCGLAAGVLKAFLVKFLGPVLWISLGLLVVGGLFAAWPWVKWAQNWSLNRLGHSLATNGNREAGVALMSTARGLTAPSSWIGSEKVSGRKGRRALAHREQRRALLAKFTPERFTPDPV